MDRSLSFVASAVTFPPIVSASAAFERADALPPDRHSFAFAVSRLGCSTQAKKKNVGSDWLPLPSGTSVSLIPAGAAHHIQYAGPWQVFVNCNPADFLCFGV